MINGYLIKLVNNQGSNATFGDSIVPNDVSVEINKDATAGVFTADVDIFGLSIDTYRAFASSNSNRPTTQTEIVAIDNGIKYSLFKGVVSNTPDFYIQDTCLSFQATSVAFGSKKIQISLVQGTSYRQLKMAFASELNLKLSTNSLNDNLSLSSDYKYYGSSFLTELKRIFTDEYVYVAGDVLCFQNKTDKTSKSSVTTIAKDITQHIIKTGFSNDINAISCSCWFLPQIDVNDVVRISFSSNYSEFFANLNGTFIVRKVTHKFSYGTYYNDTNALTDLDLLATSKIKRF